MNSTFTKGLTYQQELNIPEVATFQRIIEDEGHEMTWQRLIMAPTKHQGIIINDTVRFLGADEDFSHYGLDNIIAQQNKWFTKTFPGEDIGIHLPTDHPHCILEFLPYKTLIHHPDNNLQKYATYRQQGVDKTERKGRVYNVDSTCKHIKTDIKKGYNRGERVTIETAEGYVTDLLEAAKKEGLEFIWICTSIYCMRSFTIGPIHIPMLSYDKGDEGSTSQRASRGSTEDTNKSASLVISNSFDSERIDPKIESRLLDMTKARMARTGEDFRTAGRNVKRGNSFMKLNENGDGVQWEFDRYLAEIVNYSTSFENSIANEMALLIKNSSLENEFKNGAQAKVNRKKGPDTYVDEFNLNKKKEDDKKKLTKQQKKEANTILAVSKNIIKNIDIVWAIGSTSFKELDLIASLKNTIIDKPLTREFYSQFEVEPTYVLKIIEESSYMQELTSKALCVNMIKRLNSNAAKKSEIVFEECYDEVAQR